ncbi:MAG: hypothetical protein WD278_10310, partial [Pirellulales bacterium]
VEAIAAALQAGGHRPRRLAVASDPAALVPLVETLSHRPPAIVFNLCEGLAGSGGGESQVAGLLELFGVAITGASSDCLALVRDKPRVKWLFGGAGLPTPSFQLVRQGEPLESHAFAHALAQGRLIVKPAREDASLGIGRQSVVADFDSLVEQIERVRSLYGEVLVERFVAGREFNAALVDLGSGLAGRPWEEVAEGSLRMLPLSEIEFAPGAAPLVTYEAKWKPDSADFGGTPVRCPADAPPELADRIARLALEAFRLTGCRQYARVDLRVDDHGQPFILEVNANPDLSPSAGFARALAAAGTAYNDFICLLVEDAAGRAEQAKKRPFD